MSTNMVLSKLCFLSCPSLSFVELVLSGRKEEMHQKTPSFRSFRMHWLLHCADLTSGLHLLEADETPWKERSLLTAFPILYKVFGTLSFHSEGSALRRDSMSAYLFSRLGRYSAVTVIFFLNNSSQICLKGQIICKFLYSPFYESKSGPL